MQSATVPSLPDDLDERDRRILQCVAGDLVLDGAQCLDPGPLRSWILELAEAMLERAGDVDRNERRRVRSYIRHVRTGKIGSMLPG